MRLNNCYRMSNGLGHKDTKAQSILGALVSSWQITVLCFLGLFMTIACQAQEFTIRKVELTGESIILHYDLIDTIRARTYTINVYSSKDNFLTPLQKIKGDAGLEVKPGANRKIIWGSREEFGTSFKGDVELEVRGRVYIPFVRFDGFQNEQIIRRGKPKTMTWSGGTRQNILNFSIYKGDDYVDVIPNVANSGSFEIVLPTSIKPGKGYYFLVSDSKNKDQVMKTPTFQVKRKIPLALKALPIVAIGAVAYSLSSKKGAENIDGPPEVPTTH